MVAAQYNPDPERLCVEQEETDFFPGYQFESAHNTWCVGKIMYEMLTLAPRDSVNEAIAQVTEAQYWGPMREESMDEIETQREPEYSHDLRNLIRRCLRISPRRRPTPEQLHSAIENHFSRMSRGGLRNGRRVFYQGNEINDMPIGQRGLPKDRHIPYTRAAFRHFNQRKFKRSRTGITV